MAQRIIDRGADQGAVIHGIAEQAAIRGKL